MGCEASPCYKISAFKLNRNKRMIGTGSGWKIQHHTVFILVQPYHLHHPAVYILWKLLAETHCNIIFHLWLTILFDKNKQLNHLPRSTSIHCWKKGEEKYIKFNPIKSRFPLVRWSLGVKISRDTSLEKYANIQSKYCNPNVISNVC